MKKGKKLELLDALQVERAKYIELRAHGDPAGALLVNTLSDGGGLLLAITPNGAKSWRYHYRFHGRRRVIVYGSYPDLSLSEARKRHAKAKLQLADGIDPVERRKEFDAEQKKRQEQTVAQRKNTFAAISADWLQDERKAKSHSAAWECNTERWLRWANDEFGSRPITEITAADILKLLKRIAEDRAASAEHCRRLISRVFMFAIRTLRVQAGLNPANALRGTIKVPEKQHHPKLEPKELPELLGKINAFDGHESVKLGLQILIHVFCRKRELTSAPWIEVDLDGAIWSIAATRMKMKKSLDIPLSSQVVAMFRRLKELAGDSPFVFPSFVRPLKKPMAADMLNLALNRLGYQDRFSPHSARATAASVLADAGFNVNVIDAQLAHSKKGDTARAYFRNSYLEERRKLLQHWSDMLDGYASGAKIVPIRAA